MAEKILNTVIVLRNGSKEAWEAENSYVLRTGEVGVGYMDVTNEDGETVKTVPIIKVGDGETAWKELPQAEGVFEEDQILTYNFGRHKTANGFVNAGGKGMTTSEWLLDALSEVIKPKTTQPSTSLSTYCRVDGSTTNLDASKSVEIGSYIDTLGWNGTFSAGSYTDPNDTTNKATYGTVENGTGTKTKDTGLSSSHVTWAVSNNKSATTSEAEDGTFALTSDERIQVTETAKTEYAQITQKANFKDTAAAAVRTPLNNVGVACEDCKVDVTNPAEGYKFSKTTSVYLAGYRNSWYYVGTDYTTAIDSAFVRKATGMGSNTTSFGTVTIPAGTKRVMFAVPGTHTLASVIDVDGQGLDVKANFTAETVEVEGANGYDAIDYTVFHFENENGIAATKYTVTIN